MATSTMDGGTTAAWSHEVRGQDEQAILEVHRLYVAH